MSGVWVGYRGGLQCAFALCAFALLMGCGGTNTATVRVQEATIETEQTERAGVFAPGERILSGFDAFEDSDSWRIGDRILFGMRMIDGDESMVKFVLVELLADKLPAEAVCDVDKSRADDLPVISIGDALHVVRDASEPVARGYSREKPANWTFKAKLKDDQGQTRSINVESLNAFLRLSIFDGDARREGTYYTFGPETFLREGLIEYVLFTKPLYAKLAKGGKIPMSAFTDEQLERMLRAAASVFALGRTLWFAPQLTTIMKRMVAMPPIWSIVLNLGVRFSVDVLSAEAVDAATERPGLTDVRGAQRVPIVIKLNDSPALRVEMTAIPPRPPVHLSAGIVSLRATHLEHSEKRLSAQLLAARRAAAVAPVPAQ